MVITHLCTTRTTWFRSVEDTTAGSTVAAPGSTLLDRPYA